MMRYLVYGERINSEYDIERFNEAYFSSVATK